MRADHPQLNALIQALQRRIDKEQDIVTSGSCEDFSAYRYRCGLIDGLIAAQTEIKELDEELLKA